MGLPSPAWYDDLLLQKIKTLLESALDQPTSSRSATSYEQFVRDLDVEDSHCRRAIESIVNQTTARKPRRVTLRPIQQQQQQRNFTTAEREETAAAEAGLSRARMRRRQFPSRASVWNYPEPADPSDSATTAAVEDDVGDDMTLRAWRPERRSNSNRERAVIAAAQRRANPMESDGEEGEGEAEAEGGSQAWRDYNVSMRNYWATDDDAAAARDGLDWFTYDAEEAAAQATALADNAEQQQEQQQSQPPSVWDRSLRRHSLSDPTPPATESADEALRELQRARAAVSSDLPSLAEIWRAARESPLPVDVHSVQELTMALNASERSHATVYEATTLAQLVAELTSRDPAAGVRLRAMVRHRRSRENEMDATWLDAERAIGASASTNRNQQQQRPQQEGEGRLEPLWHSYVADLDTRGGQSRLYEHLPPNVRSSAQAEGAFEIFSRRQRALNRTTAAAGSERSSAAEGSERVSTPFAVFGEPDTPASSVALSPVPPLQDCPTASSPPPPTASTSNLSAQAAPFLPGRAPPADEDAPTSPASSNPPALTSAEIAERFARQRRSIAPMPSSARFARGSSPSTATTMTTTTGTAAGTAGTTTRMTGNSASIGGRHQDVSTRQRLRDIIYGAQSGLE